MTPTPATTARPDLPELPLDAWEPTKTTLHLWAQIVGKVKLAATAPRNHWWNVPLYLDVRGLTTRRLHHGQVSFQIDLDLVDHRLVARTNRGQQGSFRLHDGLSVAGFDRQLHRLLDQLGVDVPIREDPYGVPMTTPFPNDTEHAAYDPEYVRRFWQVLDWVDTVLEEFSGWYCGKQSPVHLFWHSFDLAVTRFSGRRAPPRDGADPVTREAYSHELISFGFWAGDHNTREPAFYSYTAPEPPGLPDQPLQPAAATWHQAPQRVDGAARLRPGPRRPRPQEHPAGTVALSDHPVLLPPPGRSNTADCSHDRRVQVILGTLARGTASTRLGFAAVFRLNATVPLQRQSHGIALDPHKLTVNQYLDRWLAHIQTTLRARTVARYRALLTHHVRPYLGAQLLNALQPLQVQGIYDQLRVGGRKPGGLDPQHILAVHRCLHRALEQAVTWRLVPRNVAKDATPPPVPHKDAAALLPQQVDLLLDAAARHPTPWLGAWTVLAAATGARNGELCGLEWSDVDLAAGTARFRQELTIVDVDVLPGGRGPDGRRKELAVGPVKSKASKAILSLPPFAVQALRAHRHQQARLRLAGAQPATVTLRWVEPGQPPRPRQLDLVFRTERGTALNPNHASRGFATLARGVGLDAHPHMLRHALASAMAANKEPASIIAAQLRHADGGALAQRVYIHQLPQTAPRVAGLIEGVFGPAARDARSASAPRRAERNRSESRPGSPA